METTRSALLRGPKLIKKDRYQSWTFTGRSKLSLRAESVESR